MPATTIPLGRAMAPEPYSETSLPRSEQITLKTPETRKQSSAERTVQVRQPQTGPRLVCSNTQSDTSLDHFIKRDGKIFAGTHLIIDLWGAKYLDDLERMESAMRDAVEAAGATLLHIHLHHFTPNGGISGVAVLAESHISVHTWPERDFAAFDVFMCGDAEPSKAIPVLSMAFRPSSINVGEHQRGVIDTV